MAKSLFALQSTTAIKKWLIIYHYEGWEGFGGGSTLTGKHYGVQ
jgi:hypothetical protein